jgi:hypothetical protein
MRYGFDEYASYYVEGKHLVKLSYWNELISHRKLSTTEQYQMNQDIALLFMESRTKYEN